MTDNDVRNDAAKNVMAPGSLKDSAFLWMVRIFYIGIPIAIVSVLLYMPTADATYLIVNASADMNDTALAGIGTDVNKNFGGSATFGGYGPGYLNAANYAHLLLWFNFTKGIPVVQNITSANFSLWNYGACVTVGSRSINVYNLKVGWYEGTGSGAVGNASVLGNATTRWLGGSFDILGANNDNVIIANTTITCGTANNGRYTFIFTPRGLSLLNGILNGTYKNDGFVLNVSPAMDGAEFYQFAAKENATAFYTPRMELTYSPIISLTFNNPAANNSYSQSYNLNYLFINATMTGDNLSACILQNGTTNITMSVATGSKSCYYNMTAQSYGTQLNIKVWGNGTTGTKYDTGWYRYYFNDTNAPVITIVSPANLTYAALPTELINVTLDEDGSCTLDFNGTNYTMSSTGNNFYYDASLPTAGNYSWRVYCSDILGNLNASVIRTLYKTVSFGVCGVSPYNRNITFTFYDEITVLSTNGSAELSIEEVGSGFSYNTTFSNVHNFTICAYTASDIVVDMLLVFWNGTSYTRPYDLYHATLSATNDDVSLYTLSNTLGDRVEIRTRNANDFKVEGAYVNVQRYYAGENIYRTVFIGKSDSTGKFLTGMEVDYIYYKPIISIAGVTVKSYDALTITNTAETPETLTLYTVTSETQFFSMLENVYASCYTNFTTNYTICVVSDPTGIATSATLVVQKMSLTDYEDVCKVSGSGSAFTLSCYLGINPDGYFKYNLYLTPSPNPIYAITGGDFKIGIEAKYGDNGLFAAALIFMALVLLGMFSAPVAALLGVVGLAGSAMMGMFDVTIGSLAGIVVIIFIIAAKGRGV